jgi:hypothetical protein
MTDRIRHIAAFSLTALTTVLTVSCATASAAEVLSPLPAADYTVRAVCGPASPGRAGCLSLKLQPLTSEARAHNHPIGVARSVVHAGQAAEGLLGLTPQDLHTAYTLPISPPTTQTIALVDSYNDPTAEADLIAYSKEFGLPECTKVNGCFKQVNQNGSASAETLPFPKTVLALEKAQESASVEVKEEAAEAAGWGVEISLDMETAHAICETCNIVLVEANSPSYANLDAAESTAGEKVGATEISNSWGGPEPYAGETQESESKGPFNRPGIVITASSGDNGYRNWDSAHASEERYANFPASSPHVVAVGGTRLELNKAGEWQGESVWNGNGASGGGCSEVFFAPNWQLKTLGWSSVGCGGLRAVADVSADADPYSGVAVHDSTPGAECEEGVGNWCTIGGTSLASPLIASVFALAGGAGAVEYPARTLYENEATSPASLHDVTSGSNAACLTPFNKATGKSSCTPQKESENSNCEKESICLAGSGYDGPTGVGTPNGLKAFEPTGKAEEPVGEEGAGGSGGGGSGGGTTGGHGTTTPVVPPLAPKAAGAPTPPLLQISALALTLNAIIALNNSHPKISQIGFSFTLTVGASVRMTLAKRIRAHRRHRAHWQTLGHSVSAFAVAGRNIWRLNGRGRLTPGSYRITLTPLHAASRSITFQIG